MRRFQNLLPITFARASNLAHDRKAGVLLLCVYSLVKNLQRIQSINFVCTLSDVVDDNLKFVVRQLTDIRRLAPRLPYRTRAAVQNTRSSISIRGRYATYRTHRDTARLSCGSRDDGW